MGHYNTWTSVTVCVTVIAMRQLPLKIFHNIQFVPSPLGGLDPCWLWKGARTTEGYGVVRIGVTRYVHIEVYELLVGPIPKGYTMVCGCEVRACCSPNHWKPLTRSEAYQLRSKWKANRKELKRQLKREKLLAKEQRRRELSIDVNWCI